MGILHFSDLIIKATAIYNFKDLVIHLLINKFFLVPLSTIDYIFFPLLFKNYTFG